MYKLTKKIHRYTPKLSSKPTQNMIRKRLIVFVVSEIVEGKQTFVFIHKYLDYIFFLNISFFELYLNTIH